VTKKAAGRWAVMLAAALGFGVMLWLATAPSVDVNSEKIPSEAPAFSFPDLKGKTVSLSDFRGKVVLLSFWATWCDPCIEEIPDLVKLQKTLGPRGFTILALSADVQGAAVVEPFAREHGINYPVLLTGGDVPESYPVPGFPTAFLIDRQGKIVERILGGRSLAELSRDVEILLAR
jgi:cytochrome c biogenesis protein CcmG, thiol:disulfide interchange protein DsbE